MILKSLIPSFSARERIPLSEKVYTWWSYRAADWTVGDRGRRLDHIGVIAIGFVVSFITAIIVVRTFLNYVTRHGFTFFAWWRVIIGTLGLIALALGR